MKLKKMTLIIASIATMMLICAASYWTPISMAQQGPESAGIIRGVVTDQSGKPIRGALVSADIGIKSVSRYTDKNGRYEISGLRPGKYDVRANAWGQGIQRQASEAKGAELDFKLAPRWDVSQLTAAEWLSYLPKNHETQVLEAYCTGCHTLNKPAERRGLVAEEWSGLLKNMTTGKMFDVGYSDAQWAYISPILEKYWGPNATMPEPNQVKHLDISDEASSATFYEFKMPNVGFVHSLTTDNNGDAWITEYDYRNNKMAKFNFDTETFTEYPLPWAKALPHTSVIDKDGRIWTPMNNVNKLIVQDPKTGAIRSYEMPADPSATNEKILGPDGSHRIGGHTVAFDSKRNLWISATLYNKILKFDQETEKFQTYDMPVPDTLPEDSAAAYQVPPGASPPQKIIAGSYDIAVDSKDKVWYSQLSLGILVCLDPITGKSKTYKAPGVPSIRGVAIDSQDNVWFSNFHGHKLMKLDQNTGQIKGYEAPTQYASVYGIVFDAQGNVWYADHAGNNITKFNPKTEHFVEYPIPTKGAAPRFFGIDSKTGWIWFTESFRDRIGILDPGTGAKSKMVANAAK